MNKCLLAAALLGLATIASAQDESSRRIEIRVATFNVSLNRSNPGDLVNDLSTSTNTQAQNVAEIIQRVDADVILLNEFDYDPNGVAVKLFRQNYLQVSQNGAGPVFYPYVFLAASNTGVLSGKDLDNNGNVALPGDGFGFGFFPGQFGMVLLSKYPIDYRRSRTFQLARWKDMPGALLPDDASTPKPKDYYSRDELRIFRLSSKSHWDVVVRVAGRGIHMLCAHPTPPVFDGPEDRNGKRNHDEIRFWADYISPWRSYWIRDDRGRRGGLRGRRFVILGDYNADPFDGDSVNGAANQLLGNRRVNTSITPSSAGGIDATQRNGGINQNHVGNPAFDTADFNDSNPGNLRVDYALPSRTMNLVDAKIFWPVSTDPLFRLVGDFPFPSSDHRAVYVDVNPFRRQR